MRPVLLAAALLLHMGAAEPDIEKSGGAPTAHRLERQELRAERHAQRQSHSQRQMNHAERSTRGRRRGVETCTSALIVIRHADDMRSNDERDSKGNKEPYGTGWSTSGIETCVRAADGNADYLAVPAGSSGVSLTAAGQPVHQHCLTPNGQAHAHAYAASLSSFLLKNRLCPVGSVVTQEPFTGKVWPSANPFETALPLAQKSGAPIAMVPSSTAFATSSERAALLEPASANSSVLLSWDKAGLMGSDNNGVLYQVSARPLTRPCRQSPSIYV
ncbi:hypothetical protein T492DRAFT_833298 [Pavlovales sp. CCMP2436]|nr:hypothetical protein T492DRAFT_833298 [Pavlovales sp. CCMP2436]